MLKFQRAARERDLNSGNQWELLKAPLDTSWHLFKKTQTGQLCFEASFKEEGQVPKAPIGFFAHSVVFAVVNKF